MTHAARTTAPIRTGVIGFGLSGRVFHTPFLAANDEYSLDVIVTGDPGRRAHAEREHPGARLFTRPEDLFAHAETMAALDLVVIASPPATHAPLAHAALDAGLAVLVDKPFTVNSVHGTELVDKADRLGLALTVFQNRRWDGDFLTLRALIEAGALGDVRRFESRFEWFKAGPGKAWKDAATPGEGGGLLYDLGAHLIDQAVQL
ncbi:MAG: Gfo/Idh/MocA family oxidoreductase, partial [Cryobacterium sp.]